VAYQLAKGKVALTIADGKVTASLPPEMAAG
jgi:hypothetical protein